MNKINNKKKQCLTALDPTNNSYLQLITNGFLATNLTTGENTFYGAYIRIRIDTPVLPVQFTAMVTRQDLYLFNNICPIKVLIATS